MTSQRRPLTGPDAAGVEVVAPVILAGFLTVSEAGIAVVADRFRRL